MNRAANIHFVFILSALLMASALPTLPPGAGISSAAALDPYVPGASCNVFVYHNDINRDLADYGLIFQDALQTTNPDKWSCAREALIRKITATINFGSKYDSEVRKTVGPYQEWLAGASVSLAMATGLLLLDRGAISSEADNKLRYVVGSYAFNRAAGCGFSGGRWQGGNNCFDDFAIAATAFAWIAAYKYKRGDPNDVTFFANSAINCINLALPDTPSAPNESVCIHRTNSTWGLFDDRGPCNGTPLDLPATPSSPPGAAEAISFNHGFQNIAYGLGLMTSISSAIIGLQTANVGYTFTDSQRRIAYALFREGQVHTDSNGLAFFNDCKKLNDSKTGFDPVGQDCGDSGLHYLPRMFPVMRFYQNLLGGNPSAGYNFDLFDQTNFKDTGFFNRGRESIYRDLTKTWHISRPPLGGSPVTPPLANIAWIKPSYASWGPANTLTVAGSARNGFGGVQMWWRDVTANGPWNAAPFQPVPSSPSGGWSNTIPVSNYCHDYEAYVVYSGSTSNRFFYNGIGSGYCPESAQVIWIQPQSTAGFGPPGHLIVAGSATGAPAGATVRMYYRDVTPCTNPPGVPPNRCDIPCGIPWTQIAFEPTPDSNGIWYNSIPNVDFSRKYEVYVRYDAFASKPCRYCGTGGINWCN